MIHLMKSAIQSAGARNTSTPFNFGASGFTMTGNAVVGGTLAVTGASTFTGAATFNGALTLNAAIALAAALTLTDVNIVLGTTTGTKIGTATTQKLGFYNATPIVQPLALTAQLTSITHTAPGTPDYALQNLVQNTGFGFATADEGNTLLSVVLNLQTRLAEVEAKLEALGLVAGN